MSSAPAWSVFPLRELGVIDRMGTMYGIRILCRCGKREQEPKHHQDHKRGEDHVIEEPPCALWRRHILKSCQEDKPSKQGRARCSKNIAAEDRKTCTQERRYTGDRKHPRT